ncbi:Putative sodium-coupled neutral amino acid transporter 7 [Araneus ventricosus]|uniref:Sodium-coupled neutral amino acid transporter 7 n=1 Tax=Araneus ventricosus TaxID=182803 RepID=A0A4Y2TQ78_ARAVE|nr:Putative sodium-coupled neutral amino acid transporter 7 [Araneus ventricosus]
MIMLINDFSLTNPPIFLAAFGSTFCHHWYLERHFTITAASLLLVLPICYFRRVDFLRYAGSLGIFAMLYPVFLTVYGYFKLDIKEIEIKHEPESISKLLVVVPVFCLAYQCQEVVVPVYACMRNRSLRNFSKSCCLTMFFLFMIYSIIGCFGYLTFGAMVSPNVMKMYDAEDPVVMFGIGALILKMVVTYPVLALCGRGAVDGLYSEVFRLSAADFVKGERRRRIVIVTLWFSSSLLIALNTSSIGTVIHALGSISAANIFIYPGICLMQVTLQTDPGMKKRKSYFLIVASVALAALGAFFFGLIIIDSFLNGGTTKAVETLCS